MRPPDDPIRVPRAMRAAFDAVVRVTDDVCRRHLTPEYAALARRLTAALARKRPSPLLKGTSTCWACVVVCAPGTVNFLFDSTQKPHLRARDLCALFGVSQSGASAKSREIQEQKAIMATPTTLAPSLGCRVRINHSSIRDQEPNA